MDSIGVSGRTHEPGNQLAGPFSSMFSSRVDEHLAKHELTETISTHTKRQVITALVWLSITFSQNNDYSNVKRSDYAWPYFPCLS